MKRERVFKIIKPFVPYILVLFLVADTAFSFLQFMSAPLDGDISSIVYPSPGYTPVMKDPFAINVLLKDTVYAAPNRFFSHWTMANYFRSAPLVLQSVAEPITSLYAAGAVAKALMQVFIIFLIAFFIGQTRDICKLAFLIPAVLITPLFQNAGFAQQMGIIDVSVTYCFFYALPTGVLLLFFYLLLKPWYYGEKVKITWLSFLILLILSVCLPLSGSLVAPVVILTFLVIFLQQYFSSANKDKAGFTEIIKSIFSKQSKRFWVLALIILLMSLYSFYIGMNNAEQQWAQLSLNARFKRLPRGIYNIIAKGGMPLLLIFIAFNLWILTRVFKSNPEGLKILSLAKWFFVFSLIYVLLLPFGGYRSYRPNIVRYDTFIPVTLCLIILFGKSAFYILKNLNGFPKEIYAAVVILFIGFFTFSDKEINHWNTCEWLALEEIRDSPDDLVEIHADCSVFFWGPVTNKADSRLNGIMMEYWNITDRPKMYFQVIDKPAK